MFFKKKKKEEEENIEDAPDDPNEIPEVPVAAPPEEKKIEDVSLGKLTAEVEKLKAQFSTFYELQKASNERFSNITEQLGSLRSMIIERDKDAQHLEAKATQAIDLVSAVQPDKFMVEIRKIDSKVEALRANLESNENIIKNTINELKEMRNRMTVFKGMEQVIKMNEDVKAELMEIKKVQALVERHADKVETIFSEMQKKFSDFIRTIDTVNDLDKSFKQISSDFDSIKVKIADFGTKKEIENLVAKFDDFEKYISNIVTLINKKFGKLEKEMDEEFSKKFSEAEKLLRGFETLAQKTPDLDKYFGLLEEEAKKASASNVKVEKIKQLGEDEKLEVPQKEGILGRVGSVVTGAKDKIAEKLKK
jgi:chromosome segregation ATPase